MTAKGSEIERTGLGTAVMELTAQSNDAEAGGKKVYEVPAMIPGPGFIIEIKERDGDQNPVKSVEFNYTVYTVDGKYEGDDKTDDGGDLHTKPIGRKIDLELQAPAGGRAREWIIIIYACGFNAYSSETEELGDSHWTPNTADFKRTADDIKSEMPNENIKSYCVNNKQEFFGALTGLPPKDKIKRVIFLGHGAANGIAFAGNRPAYSWLFDEQLVAGDFATFQATINNIKPNLTQGATIDLYSCNSAASTTYMTAFATSFDRPVRGFNGYLVWCMDPDPNGKTVRCRGRFARNSDYPRLDHCVLSGTGWKKGVNNFNPDATTQPSKNP